jgi:hypothetical protein
MGLVREQDFFFALPALVPALSPALGANVKERLRRLVAFGATAVLVFSPQLLVYQILNGAPAPSSHVRGKMEWISPHFLQVLFSPEHGLFFWSPILLLFAGGALLLWKKQREAALVLAAGFLLQVYISGAVESWTQAGAFGSRRFVGATAIFAVWGALVLAALLPRLHRVGVAALVALFVLWNVSLMVQFGLGIMDRDKLRWDEVTYNALYKVPPRFLGVVRGYFENPEDLAGSGRP